MKERPILFNGEMVRATIEDRKHQTRRTGGLKALNEGYYRDRISKVEVRDGSWCFWEVGHGSSALPVVILKCPIGVTGDRLWVRETWAVGKVFNKQAPHSLYQPTEEDQLAIDYSANETRIWDKENQGKWRPSIHMPRWASRITLEITDVRVQRLQYISEEDAKAEGVDWSEEKPMEYWEGYDKTFADRYGNASHRMIERDGVEPPPKWMDEPRIHKGSRGLNFPAKTAFKWLWNQITGEGSWDANPWVWVITFKRIKP